MNGLTEGTMRELNEALALAFALLLIAAFLIWAFT